MLSVVLWVLAVSPSELPLKPVRVAAPGVSTVSVLPSDGRAVLERFEKAAVNPKLSFVGAEELTQALSEDRRAALDTCDTPQCMSERAAAAGAEVVLELTLVNADGALTLTIRARKADSGAELKVEAITSPSLNEVNDWIDYNAHRFGEQLLAKVRGVNESSGVPGWAPVITGVAAAGFLAAGIACFVGAHSLGDRVAHPSKTETTQLPILVTQGKSDEQWGVILLAASGVALATTALLVLLNQADGEPLFGAIITSHGGALVLGVRF